MTGNQRRVKRTRVVKDENIVLLAIGLFFAWLLVMGSMVAMLWP